MNIHHCVFKILGKNSVADGHTDGRTDRRTDGQHSIPPTNKVCAGYKKKSQMSRRAVSLLFRGGLGVEGPVVQSTVSLTSSLRVISLTVLADSVYNFRKCFAEKM